MVQAMRVTLAALLLLFIYLEVLAMIGVYLDSGKLPVRMPMYIAIVALARSLNLTEAGQRFRLAADRLLEDDIKLVVGGFHLGGMEENRVNFIIKGLREKNVTVIYISHRLDEICENGQADSSSWHYQQRRPATATETPYKNRGGLTAPV